MAPPKRGRQDAQTLGGARRRVRRRRGGSPAAPSAISAWVAKIARLWRRTGTLPSVRYCFGRSPPARRPRPPATTTAATFPVMRSPPMNFRADLAAGASRGHNGVPATGAGQPRGNSQCCIAALASGTKLANLYAEMQIRLKGRQCEREQGNNAVQRRLQPCHRFGSGPWTCPNRVLLAPDVGRDRRAVSPACRHDWAPGSWSPRWPPARRSPRARPDVRCASKGRASGCMWCRSPAARRTGWRKAPASPRRAGAQVIDINMGCPAKHVTNGACRLGADARSRSCARR